MSDPWKLDPNKARPYPAPDPYPHPGGEGPEGGRMEPTPDPGRTRTTDD